MEQQTPLCTFPLVAFLLPLYYLGSNFCVVCLCYKKQERDFLERHHFFAEEYYKRMNHGSWKACLFAKKCFVFVNSLFDKQ